MSKTRHFIGKPLDQSLPKSKYKDMNGVTINVGDTIQFYTLPIHRFLVTDLDMNALGDPVNGVRIKTSNGIFTWEAEHYLRESYIVVKQ